MMRWADLRRMNSARLWAPMLCTLISCPFQANRTPSSHRASFSLTVSLDSQGDRL